LLLVSLSLSLSVALALAIADANAVVLCIIPKAGNPKAVRLWRLWTIFLQIIVSVVT
jgi:hypothetical protein